MFAARQSLALPGVISWLVGRAGYWLGDGLPVPSGAPAPDRFRGEFGRARLSRAASGSTFAARQSLALPGVISWLVGRPGYWLGHVFAFASGAPAPDGFCCENHKRDPDESEGDEMRASEWLVIKKNAEEKTAAWRQVLEKAECR